MSSDQVYCRSVDLPVAAAEAFEWHERPGALERLIPPWERVDVEEHSGGIGNGARVVLLNRVGPLRLRWVAEHEGYERGRQFCDNQVSGPFRRWYHTHRFESLPSGLGRLTDQIEYRIPGGAIGRLLGGRWIRNKIERMFDYRHHTTVADLAMHARFAERPAMRIAVTGSRGLIGSTLVPLLTTGGHRVTRLVRAEPAAGEVRWDPTAASWDAAPLEGTDAVVHLAGESVAAGRWTDELKQRIRSSRVEGTRVLCEGLARLAARPKVLVMAAAIGYYGDRGGELLDETCAAGDGFLADVARQWEDAARPAIEAGIRVVPLRIGVVLSPKGGALAKMLLPFKLGGGGRFGSGQQYWSWIACDDVAAAILHALMTESLTGPANAVAPTPVTSAVFAKTLARVLRRPAIVPMPASAARLALGEMADELLLASARVRPKRLLESGYRFRWPTLEEALRHMLGK